MPQPKVCSANLVLQKSELGPYAYEEKMPDSLYRQLQVGPKVTVVNRIGRDGRLIKHEIVDNETPGLLPVLAQLCAIDKDVRQAWLCHPSAVHICKRPKEGGFCGYRNIQMLVSYMQGAKAQGHAQFPPRTPGILVLQDLIEQAWDMGINDVSRIQTGGIKGTRKYIGTPEVRKINRCLCIKSNQLTSSRFKLYSAVFVSTMVSKFLATTPSVDKPMSSFWTTLNHTSKRGPLKSSAKSDPRSSRHTCLPYISSSLVIQLP